MDDNHVFWGFHIYARGDSFVKQGYVALGWQEMGDLGTISPTREAFKTKVRQVFGDQPHVTNSAGQLFRFVHEMKPGDHVIYRSKIDRQIHVGRVKGMYQYKPELNAEYCNIRTVEWIKTVPATQFSQGALYELGSALTLFQVKNYAEEFRFVLSGESKPMVENDETVTLVAEEIEQTTSDYILKQLARHLKGHSLQAFVADLLNTMGYRTLESPVGTDEGVDIVAHKDELMLEPPIIKVQVKSTDSRLGGEKVREMFGILGPGEYGLVICLGGFSRQGEEFAKSKPNLRLIDGEELVRFVLEHYEEMNPRFKALVPLKHVYIPPSIGQES